jgi:hypothetical protein
MTMMRRQASAMDVSSVNMTVGVVTNLLDHAHDKTLFFNLVRLDGVCVLENLA